MSKKVKIMWKTNKALFTLLEVTGSYCERRKSSEENNSLI